MLLQLLNKNYVNVSKALFTKEYASRQNTVLRFKCRIFRHAIHTTNAKPTTLNPSIVEKSDDLKPVRELAKSGPSLRDFLLPKNETDRTRDVEVPNIPYITNVTGRGQKVFFKIYGCQMNVNDTEIVWSILKSHGYEKVDSVDSADVVLVVTCSIRDNAEQKVWNLLQGLNAVRRKRSIKRGNPMKIGLLGCMAERLKHKILERGKLVDVVAGPDSYKDLPRLLAMPDDEAAINVILSFDETYADVMPVRLNTDSVASFVTIMRGCDNMCTYCIVPFTRGRERSRPVDSIVEEIRQLSGQGVKEVTLLGQNVNSYRDTSQSDFYTASGETQLARGFKTVYKKKKGGLRFGDLLDRVSLVDPEMRIRFTSPHPKDFPDDVLQLIAERSNICKSLHVPAQSGNSAVLERMRRGYTREAYIDLINHIRETVPNVSLSTDFIAGFCGETEEEFQDTLSLIQLVKYNTAFLFYYSMREKTTAHRRYKDDVEHDVKLNRLQRMIDLYLTEAKKLNQAQIGQLQLVLVEGESKKSREFLQGKNDGNIRVIIPDIDIPDGEGSCALRKIRKGDYVVTRIKDANAKVLQGEPLFHSSIAEHTASFVT